MAKANFSPFLAAGNVVFVSGQRGAKDGIVVPGGVKAELRQAFSNIGKILDDAGLSLDDIVKVTLFIVDLERHIADVDAEYVQLLRQPMPARTAVGINALTGKATIAVDVIAKRRAA